MAEDFREKDLLHGSAAAPATCGELVQGRLGQIDFLVSCPIDWFSRARVWLAPASSSTNGAPPIHLLEPGLPGGGAKARQACRQTLMLLGAQVREAWLEVKTQVPPGKGLGSSTADIVAVIFATARALGKPLHPWAAARIALGIEPSDSIMFPQLTRFDHRRGLLCRLLGPPPPLQVFLLDLGGEVDTGQFNQRPDLDQANAAKEPLLVRSLSLLEEGIKRQDPVLVGKGATLSALAHQAILPKEGLEELIEAAHARGAYGVSIAHSGTVVGVLLPPGPLPPGLKEKLLLHQGWQPLGTARIIGGGARSLESAKTAIAKTGADLHAGWK